MKAIRLRTEYLNNPIGIDLGQPRLMWNCTGGVTQTAYRIVCERSGEVLWDSGKTESGAMRAVYPEQLASRERVVWRVQLWDENDVAGEWASAFFETGLLDPADWMAKWITGNYRVNQKLRYPVDCFRKRFFVSKPVTSARLYATACGLYEARLCGERVGTFCFAPGHTDYRRRVQYQVFDVTNLLRQGENELTAQLADGWYRGSTGAWGLLNQYGTETKLLMQLEIRCDDGTVQTVGTDKTWDWSNDGPIRFADNKDGEIVEAWRVPSYGGKAKETRHTVVPSASNNVPVTEHEMFTPVMTTAPNGKLLLDFGQNLAGYVAFAVSGRRGQRMLWRFGELLDADGNLTLKNIQLSGKKKTTPLQQIEYFCRDGENAYRTTFAVFGFRYAEVETDVPFDPASVRAIAVYSDMERAGTFACSNDLVNRFVSATEWSMKSNHLDVPTDCPTRERHGWTGDAQIFFGTASCLADFAAFAKKYLTDVYDWQKKDGRLPQIAPYGGVDFYMWTMNGSVGWSDIGILYPYRFWKVYGDRAILEQFYDRMAKYAGFMIRRIGRDGMVRKGQSYGEWAEPADVCAYDWKDFVRPHPLVSTAYTAYVLGLMAEISGELGKQEDAERFRKFSERCRDAYRKNADLDTDRQAELVRPLYMHLLDAEQTAYAKTRLLKALDRYGWRLGTGFLSTPLILDVLTEIDIEAAYRLLENEQIPGWLSMPRAGATTVWEAWEGPNSTSGGIGSLNHYSKGAVCEWLFKTVCGIRVAGENRFAIAPRPGGRLTHAEACYQSVYGEVKSAWKKTGGRTVFEITVPANCEAMITLLDGRTFCKKTGSYTFMM